MGVGHNLPCTQGQDARQQPPKEDEAARFRTAVSVVNHSLSQDMGCSKHAGPPRLAPWWSPTRPPRNPGVARGLRGPVLEAVAG